MLQIWPTWQATLDRLVVNDTTPPSVFVTGHSMGAAVGMLGAYATQEHLNAKLGADKVGRAGLHEHCKRSHTE